MRSPELLIRLVISCGPPRSKKTHNRLVHDDERHYVLPSKQWCAWQAIAVPLLKLTCDNLRQGPHSRVGTSKLLFVDAYSLYELPLEDPVNCRALFYQDKDVSDATGLYQGLGDLLQASKKHGFAGIVKNDKQIRSWDGTRLLVDKEHPRVELELTLI